MPLVGLGADPFVVESRRKKEARAQENSNRGESKERNRKE